MLGDKTFVNYLGINELLDLGEFFGKQSNKYAKNTRMMTT